MNKTQTMAMFFNLADTAMQKIASIGSDAGGMQASPQQQQPPQVMPAQQPQQADQMMMQMMQMVQQGQQAQQAMAAALSSMSQKMDEVAMLASAPRITELMRDKDGRPIGSRQVVSPEVMGSDEPALVEADPQAVSIRELF